MTARLLLRMGDGNSQWLDEELGSMAGHPCRLLAQRGQWGLWKLLESVQIRLHERGQAGSTDRGAISMWVGTDR